jgi:uncharacterized damage-inducible protein DinB
MAAFEKKQFLSRLIDRTELITSNTKSFLRLNNEQLNQKPAPGKWSIAEIFEHLNIAHDIYIRCILSKISKAPEINSSTFKSNWLGDFAYTQIMPREDGTIFRLPAPKKLQPKTNKLDGADVLDRFLQQQDNIQDILQHVANKDLERIKIPFAFTNLLRLRLGDNLRFIIAHNERHMLQAQRIMEKILQPELI